MLQRSQQGASCSRRNAVAQTLPPRLGVQVQRQCLGARTLRQDLATREHICYSSFRSSFYKARAPTTNAEELVPHRCSNCNGSGESLLSEQGHPFPATSTVHPYGECASKRAFHGSCAGNCTCADCQGSGRLRRGGYNKKNRVDMTRIVGSKWTAMQETMGWRHFRVIQCRKQSSGVAFVQMQASCDTATQLWLNAANLKDRDLWAAGWLQMSEMQDPQGAQAAGGVTCRACSGSGATPCPVCDATGAVLLKPSALPGGPGGAAGAGGPLSSLAVVMGRSRSPGPAPGAEGRIAEGGEEGQEGAGFVEMDVEGQGALGAGQVAV